MQPNWTPEKIQQTANAVGGKESKSRALHLGRVGDAALMDIPALADCKPGLDPLEYNVVVAPAQMPDRIGSVFIPNNSQDRMGDAIQIGRIVAVSPLAFTYEAWPEGSHPPQPGDVVWIVKFGGSLFIGADEREYRFVKDKDVIAVIGM